MQTAKIVGLFILLNSSNGFVFGYSIKHGAFWLLIGTGLIYLFLGAFLYNAMIKSMAQRRTVTNPITSFDQKASINVALVVSFLLGLPFAWIGYSFF